MADPKNLDDLKEDLKEKGKLQDPYPAPEGYFDDLSHRIQQRITEEEDAERESSSIMIRMQQRWYYAAAAIAILILSIWLIRPSQNMSEPTATATNEDRVQALLAEVSNEAMIDYLQMNSVDVFTSVSLTETEQEELLESELESYYLPEDYYPEAEVAEDYL